MSSNPNTDRPRQASTGQALASSPEWHRLIAISGEAGRRWVEDFNRDGRPLHMRADEALLALRQKRLAEGRAVLDEVRETLLASNMRPSVKHLLERTYHGILSYYHYALEEYPAASEELKQAHRALELASSRHEFLLPLVFDCQEFRLHHARIARNQRQWRSMRAHIDEAEQALLDKAPICILTDGREIFYGTVQRFFESLPGVDFEQEELLHELFSEQQKIRRFRDFVSAMYLIPDFAIPYR